MQRLDELFREYDEWSTELDTNHEEWRESLTDIELELIANKALVRESLQNTALANCANGFLHIADAVNAVKEGYVFSVVYLLHKLIDAQALNKVWSFEKNKEAFDKMLSHRYCENTTNEMEFLKIAKNLFQDMTPFLKETEALHLKQMEHRVKRLREVVNSGVVPTKMQVREEEKRRKILNSIKKGKREKQTFRSV